MQTSRMATTKTVKKYMVLLQREWGNKPRTVLDWLKGEHRDKEEAAARVSRSDSNLFLLVCHRRKRNHHQCHATPVSPQTAIAVREIRTKVYMFSRVEVADDVAISLQVITKLSITSTRSMLTAMPEILGILGRLLITPQKNFQGIGASALATIAMAGPDIRKQLSTEGIVASLVRMLHMQARTSWIAGTKLLQRLAADEERRKEIVDGGGVEVTIHGLAKMAQSPVSLPTASMQPSSPVNAPCFVFMC